MPNELNEQGLTIKTLDEIVTDLGADLQGIYGADANFAQNSPDGQLINIFAQATEDMLELLLAAYNTFGVQTAFGIYLDQRVALNGIARRAGTHTITDVTVTTSGALNLVGLDALVNDPTAVVFTVADGDGVEYKLQASVSIGASGDHVLAFQAANIGVIQPTVNTITNQVTVVAGVTQVNNPTAATSIGVAEETDAQLKIRQTQSFFLASTGPADAVEATLLALPDVIDAFVPENDTNSPVNGVPAYSIWAIVNGGTSAEIGQAIYAKKSVGCGMKGSTTYVVSRPNGTTFTAKWDAALTGNLYIKFTLTSRVPNVTFDTDFLKDQLVAALVYRLNQVATIGDIVVAMLAIEPRAICTVLGVSSDGMSYVDKLAPSDYQHYWLLSTARIAITVP